MLTFSRNKHNLPMNKNVNIAFNLQESVSEPLLLNFLVCTLAERGFNVVMVDNEYVRSVAPVWFQKFSKGDNSLSFISLKEVEKQRGSFFVHNSDDVIPFVKGKVVKINSKDPATHQFLAKMGT